MDKQQIYALIRKVQDGDKDAADELVRQNIKLVHSVVGKMSSQGKEYEDLFQTGCIGLLSAAKRFDFSKDVMFSTYAVHMISGELRRFLRDDRPVKVSRKLMSAAWEIKKESDKIFKEQGRYPRIDELSELTNLSKEDILMAMEASEPMQYLQQPSGEDGNMQLQDVLAEDGDGFDENIISSLSLQEATKNLEDREKYILAMRYCKGKTQADVAREIGISQVQVSRIEKKILCMLREKIG